MDKVSAVKEQNLNALYAEQRALCQQRDAAMETLITMECQLNAPGARSRPSLSFKESEFENVFERRKRNKQNILSVLKRFKHAHQIRVRRR
jgi:hypothetical protein